MRHLFAVPLLVFTALAVPTPAAAQKAVIVVRHAENDMDTLTEVGRAQAARLAVMLQSADIGSVYSTNSKRTLWDFPVAAFVLEGLLLFGGIFLCVRAGLVRPKGVVVFGAAMLGIQAYLFVGPPPASTSAAAVTALTAYALFAGIIHRMERVSGTNVPRQAALLTP